MHAQLCERLSYLQQQKLRNVFWNNSWMVTIRHLAFCKCSWDFMQSPLKATRSWSPLVAPELSSWAVKSFHPSFHEYELGQVRAVFSSLVVFCIIEGQSTSKSTVSFSLVGQAKSPFSLTSSTPLSQGTVILVLQRSCFLTCFSANRSLKSNSANQTLKISQNVTPPEIIVNKNSVIFLYSFFFFFFLISCLVFYASGA